jgi:molybdenum cofactor cytidylyltransferase
MQRIVGMVLAAGRSTRFGSDKRQAILPDGRCMLEAVLQRFHEVFDTVLLVARDHDDFAQRLADVHGSILIVNEHADLGMGHSLACGAQALMVLDDVAGVVIGLADMPAVAATTLHDIKDVLAARKVPVAPRYQGQLGHPRGLPSTWFEAMGQLTGEHGARQLLDWRQAVAVHVNDRGVLLDADTPEDLARLAGG